MRHVLQVNEPQRNTISLKMAALVGFFLVLPFPILESLNQTITRQNAPGLIFLFGLLWLLALSFILVLVPLVRTALAKQTLLTNPLALLSRLALLALIAIAWGGIVIDQLPCFLGVPNCD